MQHPSRSTFPKIAYFGEFEYFFLAALHGAIILFFFAPDQIITLQHKIVGFVKNILGVDRIGMTFTKRKIINGIQEIGFAHSVIAEKTI